MTTLTKDDVDHLAHLAKLIIPEENYEDLLKEFSRILSVVEKMDAVDTSQVEPQAHPYDEKQPLRDDTVAETDQRALFQSIAPQTEAGLYIVPAVIDNES